MKIALVNPPFLFPCRQEIVLSHCLGLRYLSASLKAAGHCVQFIDALAGGLDQVEPFAGGVLAGLPIPRIVAQIDAQTDLVAVSVPFSQLAHVGHRLVAAVRARLPRARIIVGGVYPSTQPELALQAGADAIVVGEGEAVMAEIAAGGNLDRIAGVYTHPLPPGQRYASAAAIDDLDALPRADDEIPHMSAYFELSPRAARGRRVASIITSRGCPFDCEFCSVHPVCGRRWRAMSPARVIDDVDYLMARHQVRELEIEDDNFTLDASRAGAILEGFVALGQRRGPLAWRAPNGIRIDTIDAPLAKLIARSNCTSLTVALEHGDAEMLEIMNKRLDLDRAYEALSLLTGAGVRQIVVFIIVGYPGETARRFERSIAFLRRLRRLNKRIIPCVNIAQPYPGTRLLQRCLAEGIIASGDFADFASRPRLLSTNATVPIETADFDAAEVFRRRRRICRTMPALSWPQRVANRIRRAVDRGATRP
ncbi:MAG: B12-binding domain-containing radical SAM protein [Planctomycetaceae bacterium]|nr:B12-binding domain-containing radical SAM protein [Planctomycetaceae bacterium]